MKILTTVTYGVIAMGTCAASPSPQSGQDEKHPGQTPAVEEKVVIDKIWSAVSVGYCLLTQGDMQYVAYYDSERNLAVGMRRLGEKKFTKAILPSKQGWDSHNYITMAIDEAGYIHLSGNMHAAPLVYFRSQKPGDIATMVRVKAMIGENERRCTYPKFMKDAEGRLIFHYRDGGSGNGVEIYNIYETQTKTWKRFLDQPLISGLGKSSAYQRGPVVGPDGWYHLIWMWRDTPDVVTNHDLSYARSRDLIHWEDSSGQPLSLPITPNDRGTVIDPVPVKGGLHNSNHHLGFDRSGRVVVTYFKYDGEGNTQAYVARLEDAGWVIRPISDWQGRHLFRGGGSGPSSFGTHLSVGRVQMWGADELAVPFSHWIHGNGLLVIDDATLKPIRVDPKPVTTPPKIAKVQSDFKGMHVKWAGDTGPASDPHHRYVLRWETLGTNRDRRREGELPENTDLVLYKIGVPHPN